MRIACIGILVAEIDGKLEAYDRLDAVARHLVGEFQRPEHVVGVGQGERRLAVGLGEFTELGDLDRALQQRIGGMDVEMDESGNGHGMVLGSRAFGGSDHTAGFSRRLATRWWRLHSLKSTRNPSDRAPFPLIPKDTAAIRAGRTVAPRPRSFRRTASATRGLRPLPRKSSTCSPPWTGTYVEHCSFFVLAVKA